MASLPDATPTATVVGRLLRVVAPDPSAGLDWLRAAGLARQNAKRPRIQDASGAPLVQLSLEEGFFLAFEVKALRILSGSGAQLDAPGAERLFAELQPRFAAYAAAYSHFRRAGWEVTSGLKYGVDYLLYPQESGHAGAHVHAPFSVVVHVPGGASPSAAAPGGDDGWGGQHDLSWKTIQGYSRLSCQVSKQLIVAVVEDAARSHPPEPPPEPSGSTSALPSGAPGETSASGGGSEGPAIEERVSEFPTTSEFPAELPISSDRAPASGLTGPPQDRGPASRLMGPPQDQRRVVRVREVYIARWEPGKTGAV